MVYEILHFSKNDLDGSGGGTITFKTFPPNLIEIGPVVLVLAQAA